MPYLTPQAVTGDYVRYGLLIPASIDWLSIVRGALSELSLAHNWERVSGGINADEAAYIGLLIEQSLEEAKPMAKIGTVQMGLFAAAPAGWLLMDGSNYAMDDYPDLMDVYPAALKDTPAAGRFVVPDMRGRVPVGVGLSYTLNQSGGAETHTLTVAEMPSHTHTRNAVQGGGSFESRFATGTGSGTPTPVANNTTGGGQAHNNMQPYRVLGMYLVAADE